MNIRLDESGIIWLTQLSPEEKEFLTELRKESRKNEFSVYFQIRNQDKRVNILCPC